MTEGFLIPDYNHGDTIGSVVISLLSYGKPIIVVDDGNGAVVRRRIEAAAQVSSLVHIVTRARNGGKGAAMIDGFREAERLGLSHVLQIDADGQHDIEAVPLFLQASEENPEAVICGYPVYDESVPEKRLKGREVSNNYVRFLTQSDEPRDVLCGFRVYPVKEALKAKPFNKRMGFDPEILVRLSWRGVPIINKPVKVSYPKDGVSNFRMVRDNVQISLMFTRLTLGMVLRLPMLLLRKRKKARGA